MFSEHSKIKSEIINRKVTGKFRNIWKLNNTFLKAHGSWSKNKFEEKINMFSTK